jgi:hypothetical protein
MISVEGANQAPVGGWGLTHDAESDYVNMNFTRPKIPRARQRVVEEQDAPRNA